MAFNWKECEKCGRKHLNAEKHYEKFHKKELPTIPIENYPEVQFLLKKSKLQVVRQKPELLIRIAPFNHQPTSVGGITLEIGKTYKVEGMR